jgi:hypothetical protein
MSTQANIIAFDGAATPVSHTFVPDGASKDVVDGYTAEWSEKSLTLPSNANIRIRQAKKLLKSGAYRTATIVVVPVMETISNQNSAGYTAMPKVAFEETGQYVQFSSPRSNITIKRLVRQLVLNVVGGVAVSVTPVTTGFGPELHDQLIVAA